MPQRFPMQGIKLPTDEAHKVTELFLDKFHTGPRPRTYLKDGKEITVDRTLTWMTFQQSAQISRENLDPLIFQQEGFYCHSFLYIMVWNWGDVVYEVTPSEAKSLIQNKEARHNEDHYIFPPSLKWCVAVTHDAWILLAGQL